MSAPYEPVIGLEIHVQLRTRTKMFCGCEVSFGASPNTQTCPICLGLPGALPVANARAVHHGLMIGLALGCELAPRSIFHRKNYFYPDLPKGYQISQYDEPLCRGGRLGGVRVHRVHLEEDAAKLIHVGASGRIHGSDASIVDFNRGGTPLVEIVTEPDLRSPAAAGEWLRLLRVTLRQLGVSDVNMEEGSLRVDANVSLRQADSSALGVKTELKNLNSFRFLEQGIRAELARQQEALRGGGQVVQETLHFDPATGAISALRSKEEAHDYRYFPEPDLLPVVISEEMIAAARAEMPEELPAARAERLEHAIGLTGESARALAFHPERGDVFDEEVDATTEPQPLSPARAQVLANLLTIELPRRIGPDVRLREQIAPGALLALSGMISDGVITSGAARQVLDRLARESGADPEAIVREEGLQAIAGQDEELAAVVAAALRANPDAATRVREGQEKAIGPIVGHVMRETRGRADGREVTRLVHEQLGL
jgi:aspartyl-tRNA(Asn)/glutamyl-tRNA(Gln) amidotransferase subunit B